MGWRHAEVALRRRGAATRGARSGRVSLRQSNAAHLYRGSLQGARRLAIGTARGVPYRFRDQPAPVSQAAADELGARRIIIAVRPLGFREGCGAVLRFLASRPVRPRLQGDLRRVAVCHARSSEVGGLNQSRTPMAVEITYRFTD